MDIAKMSDSEIVTLSICGKLLEIDFENASYSFVKRNLSHFRPRNCCRTHTWFNWTRRALLQVTDLIWKKLAQSFLISFSRFLRLTVFPFWFVSLGGKVLLSFLSGKWHKL